MDHHGVRDRAAEQFDTDRILDNVITAVNTVRLAGRHCDSCELIIKAITSVY